MTGTKKRNIHQDPYRHKCQKSLLQLSSSKQVRLALSILFEDAAPAHSPPPHSRELWSLCRSAVSECLPWLEEEDQKRVQLALPKLVGASVPPGKGVVKKQFVSVFMAVRRKLLTRRRAAKVLALAREREKQGLYAAACELYRSCLELVPLNADCHFSYAMLLWSTTAALTEVEESLRTAISCSATPQQAQEARSKLALLLMQREGQEEEARKLLMLGGFRYRLSTSVLQHNEEQKGPLKNHRDDQQQKLLAVLDGALPGRMLSHLQEAFFPDSSFWKEHGYCSYPPSPYFSYLHGLDGSPKTSMDQVIRLVQQVIGAQFPGVLKACCAEWWAHCRPHPHGHQLHFDSDNEGEGGVRNPIATAVLYLTEGVGGPTLMTTQHIKHTKLAERGWLAFPRLNRLVAIDGEYLHGVIPGRETEEGLPQGRRISLMVAFWGWALQGRPWTDGRPGACIPCPDPANLQSTRSSWWAGMQPMQGADAEASRELTRVGAQPVECVWEDVCRKTAAHEGCGVDSLDALPNYDLCFQGF
mmetsp:Transcript_31876/g.90537  ORF Transcript_31876/g.90537 Transcript_31876/m.90537 type:complete len:529 (+) Transcript_31876:37-1623(+)